MPALGIRSARRRGVLWLFVFLLAASSACSFASPGEEARASEIQETQQNTALEIRLALSRAADAEEKEKLCLRLIEECPQTEEAEEAYWTLSDLYLDGFAEPREDEARKILEQFLERYPSSPWALHAKSRLLWLCGEEFF